MVPGNFECKGLTVGEANLPIASEERQGDIIIDDQTFHKRLAEAMPGQKNGWDGEEVVAKCEALCTLYLDASNKQRLQLIHTFRKPLPGEERPPFAPFDQLAGYINSVTGRIHSEKDVYPLYLGLAAAAIRGDYPDFREVLVALGHLHYTATQIGIDPTPYFEEIAASTVPETRKFLQTFLARDDVKRKQAIRIYGLPRHKEIPDSEVPRTIFELAYQEAQRLNRSYTSTGDLLLGLLHLHVVTDLLKELGVDSNAVRTVTEAAIETSTDPDDRTVAWAECNLTRGVLKISRLAGSETLWNVNVCAFDYLLAMIHEGKNTAAQVLQSLDVDYERAKAAALKVFEEQAVIVGDYDE